MPDEVASFFGTGKVFCSFLRSFFEEAASVSPRLVIRDNSPYNAVMNRLYLKIIACVTMLIDHICYVFFEGSAAASIVRLTIGRVAFPLFAFMIVRGFIYTRSRLKYARNKLITALASELIYDSLFYRRLFYWQNQNIIFLLLLGLVMLCILEKLDRRLPVQLLVTAGFGAAAYFLKLDYSFWGILVIAVFYFTRNMPFYQSGLIACFPLAAGYGTIGAFLSVIPLYAYKETRGRFRTAGKYAFYLFYPVHLAVLLLIRTYL